MVESTQVGELVSRGVKDAFYVGVGVVTIGAARGVALGQRLVADVAEAGQSAQERAEALAAKRSEGLSGYREDLENVVDGLTQMVRHAGNRSRVLSEGVAARGREAVKAPGTSKAAKTTKSTKLA